MEFVNWEREPALAGIDSCYHIVCIWATCTLVVTTNNVPSAMEDDDALCSNGTFGDYCSAQEEFFGPMFTREVVGGNLVSHEAVARLRSPLAQALSPNSQIPSFNITFSLSCERPHS